MAAVDRVITTTPDHVWAVLADGWLYPVWVVGASRMREVEASWPSVGAALHHSVGAWPVLIDDITRVEEAVPEQRLVLTARGWPMGEARVVLELTPHADGTHVTIEEDAVSGPGALVPAPLRHLPIAWRNTETLRRLAYLAERHARG